MSAPAVLARRARALSHAAASLSPALFTPSAPFSSAHLLLPAPPPADPHPRLTTEPERDRDRGRGLPPLALPPLALALLEDVGRSACAIAAASMLALGSDERRPCARTDERRGPGAATAGGPCERTRASGPASSGSSG